MTELFLTGNNELIPEAAWKGIIGQLTSTELSQRSHAETVEELQERISTAVNQRIPSEGKLGVLFSGGIDSTLIAFLLKKQNIDFTCITVGFHDGNAKVPEDVDESQKIAKKLEFNQEIVLLNLGEAEEIFKETAKILGKELTNVVNIGVGAVEVAGIKRAKELGITHLFGGLGSEEIFAGYDRHEKALGKGGTEALHQECIAGLQGMWQRDLQRDVAIFSAQNTAALTPFLDGELIRFTSTIPPSFKIDPERKFTGKLQGDVDGERLYKKLILREAAKAFGLPEQIAFRPKRAAQYGSRTNNALTMLRKKYGLRDKSEYLKQLSEPHQ